MFDSLNIDNRFKQQGYIIIPQLFDREQINKLRLICNRILKQWFERFTHYRQKPRRKNCSQLTDLYYF